MLSDELRRLLTVTLESEADVDPAFLLENVPIGIVKLRVGGECLFANAEFADYLGTTADQLTGDALVSEQWLGATALASFRELLRKAASQGRYGPSTLAFKTAAGVSRILYSRGTRTQARGDVHVVGLFAREPLWSATRPVL